MRIFCRSSGILKIVQSSLPHRVGPPERGRATEDMTAARARGDSARSADAGRRLAVAFAPSGGCHDCSFGWPRLHLVADRLLRRRDHLGGAALGRRSSPAADLEKWWAFTVSFLVSSPSPRMRTPSAVPLTRPLAFERRQVDGRRRRRRPSRSPTLTTWYVLVPGGVAEAALRDAAEQRHLAAFEQAAGHLGAGAGVLALVPRLAVLPCPVPMPRPTRFFSLRLWTPAGERWSGPLRVSTPRSRATSSRVRSCSRPSMVALTRLSGLVLPCTLVRMLRMPQACEHLADAGAGLDAGARAGRHQDDPAAAEPADDPVRDRVAAQLRPCFCRLIVSSPSLIAFSTAGGTSLALP